MHISSSANAKADGADEGIKPLCQYMEVWNPVEEPDGQLCALILHSL